MSAHKPSIFQKKDPHPERKVRPDPEQAELQKQLDKALKDTFPASDPPAVTQPTKAGTPKKRKSPRKSPLRGGGVAAG